MTLQKAFVEFAHKEVLNNSLYLWGGQGEFVLDQTPEYVIKKETNNTNAARVLTTLANKVGKGIDMTYAKYFDFSGLVVWLLTFLELITGDYTANDIYNKLCYAIPREKLKGGDLVFKSQNGRMVHVGIYSKNYGVIEAAGRDEGLVEKPLDANKWTSYARLRCLQK